MSDIKVTRRKLSDYKPDPKNANKGTERGEYMLEQSISDVGLGRSIVVTADDHIPAGNGTWQKAGELGIEDVIEVETDGHELVVVKRRDWETLDDEHARKYAYWDNRSGETRLAWDVDQILADVEAGMDLSALWFDDELEELLADVREKETPADPGAQVDRAAELLEVWQVERGQVWEVPSATVAGKCHRVMCGDSTSAEDVTYFGLMDGIVDGVITDPPYSFGLGSTYKASSKSGGWHDMMNNSQWFRDRLKQWDLYFVNGPIWIFTNWRTSPILMRASHDAGIPINSMMVWYKDWIGPGGSVGLRPSYELVGFFAVGDYAIKDRGVSDFVNVPFSSHKPHGHLAEKPVDLIKYLLDVSDVDTIHDPFVGSGTTLVACEQTGRIGYGMELEPKYIAVTLQRLADMGLEPRLVDA